MRARTENIPGEDVKLAYEYRPGLKFAYDWGFGSLRIRVSGPTTQVSQVTSHELALYVGAARLHLATSRRSASVKEAVNGDIHFALHSFPLPRMLLNLIDFAIASCLRGGCHCEGGRWRRNLREAASDMSQKWIGFCGVVSNNKCLQVDTY